MKRINKRFPKKGSTDRIHFSAITQDIILGPMAIMCARILNLNGINFHQNSSRFACRMSMSKLRGSKIPLSLIYSFLFRPIDSVRYFEFGSSWQALSREKIIGRYLDVSSPRLLPLAVLQEYPRLAGTILNPDRVDLKITKEIAQTIALKNKVRFSQQMIEDLDAEDESFDLITSISVLEHIEDEGRALEKIWRLLKKGGCLIISMPCSKKPFEEYVDFDEYRLRPGSDDEFIFGQRFYDDALLQERVFSITSLPSEVRIYGEKVESWWFKNRDQRLMLGRKYAQWKEPIRMLRHWKEYYSVNDLPGVGVVILKFRK